MAADSIALRAPAKINLTFRILGRREDGYHEIETLMAPVSLYDELTISTTPGEEVVFCCDDATLPSGGGNLVEKAAAVFRRASGVKAGVRMELRKRIPHGAGLGGGSSDAAAALLGLERLFGCGFSRERLREMAAEIGSDVPFFIGGGAAMCRGRGEIVEAVSLSTKLQLLLLKPGFGVPTPWAYSRWRDAAALPGVLYEEQECAGIGFVNDLERPVFEKYPFLAAAKMWLLEQPEVGAALMSGSGSTMCAVLQEPAAAERLGERARAALDAELWTCACEVAEERL